MAGRAGCCPHQSPLSCDDGSCPRPLSQLSLWGQGPHGTAVPSRQAAFCLQQWVCSFSGPQSGMGGSPQHSGRVTGLGSSLEDFLAGSRWAPFLGRPALPRTRVCGVREQRLPPSASGRTPQSVPTAPGPFPERRWGQGSPGLPLVPSTPGPSPDPWARPAARQSPQFPWPVLSTHLYPLSGLLSRSSVGIQVLLVPPPSLLPQGSLAPRLQPFLPSTVAPRGPSVWVSQNCTFCASTPFLQALLEADSPGAGGLGGRGSLWRGAWQTRH